MDGLQNVAAAASPQPSRVSSRRHRGVSGNSSDELAAEGASRHETLQGGGRDVRRRRARLGHYVANASLATGVYETLNNFIAAPPQHPTVFEYFRKELKRPASDAWVIAPSMGFERIGESRHAAYGPGASTQPIDLGGLLDMVT